LWSLSSGGALRRPVGNPTSPRKRGEVTELVRRPTFSPSPRSSRGEGWGEGLFSASAARGGSPSSHLRCDPTSPRKRGEVKERAQTIDEIIIRFRLFRS
jgi:hypothetical protein